MFFDDMPEVSIQTLTDIPQKTIMVDRNGEELYTFFEQDRTYVPFEHIPAHVVDAFVSAEDRNYWTHEGIDKRWVMRAVLNNANLILRDQGEWLQWWSTIAQQLIKNVYLSNERSILRKVQEWIITRKMYTLLDKAYRESDVHISDQQADYLVRQKILELYLNQIFLWNNSYGIESAARRYFQKDLKDISLLESAILWGLPQAPSKYNPLVNTTEVMWDRYIKDGKKAYILEDQWAISDTFVTEIKKSVAAKIRNYPIDKTNEHRVTDFRTGTFENNGAEYEFSFMPGRKDYVLWAMFQEWHITHKQLLDAYLEGIDYTFGTYTYEIQAPHFVFFVRDFILTHPEFKDLGISMSEFLNGWYTIHTSLDMNLQRTLDRANDATKQALFDMWWSNRALLHVDPRNGDIKSYLWSINYFDAGMNGQFDVIQSGRRQMWSTLKPLIYAKLLETFPFGIWSNIADTYLDTWPGRKPQNADGAFLGIMKLSAALNNSRNLTAIRAHYALWWEAVTKPYLKSLWLDAMRDDEVYGYGIVLWAAESSLKQLAQAYLQLSTPHDDVPLLNPVMRITSPSGRVIYDKQAVKNNKKVSTVERIIPKPVSFLVREMLTKRQEVTKYWREHVTYEGIWDYAIKSWTSDIKVNGLARSKDGYIVIYTPHDMFLSRAWNNTNKPLGSTVFGSMITKPFVQEYVSALWADRLMHSGYEFPWDIDAGMYTKTIESEIPPKAQEYLWGF